MTQRPSGRHKTGRFLTEEELEKVKRAYSYPADNGAAWNGTRDLCLELARAHGLEDLNGDFLVDPVTRELLWTPVRIRYPEG